MSPDSHPPLHTSISHPSILCLTLTPTLNLPSFTIFVFRHFALWASFLAWVSYSVPMYPQDSFQSELWLPHLRSFFHLFQWLTTAQQIRIKILEETWKPFPWPGLALSFLSPWLASFLTLNSGFPALEDLSAVTPSWWHPPCDFRLDVHLWLTVGHCSSLPIKLWFPGAEPWLSLFTLESSLWGHNTNYLSYELTRATHWKWNIPLGKLETFTGRLAVCIFLCPGVPSPPSLQVLQLPASVRVQWVRGDFWRGQHLPLFCMVEHLRNRQVFIMLRVGCFRSFPCGLLPNSTTCPQGRTLCTLHLFTAVRVLY